MASGIPVVVSDVGAFSDLPHAACIKIPIGTHEEDLLSEVLRNLVVEEELRRRIGSAGLATICTSHRPESTARAYLDFAHQVLSSAATNIRQVSWLTNPIDHVLPQLGGLEQHGSISVLESEIALTIAELGISSSFNAISEEWP
jgi:hypothetical protein